MVLFRQTPHDVMEHFKQEGNFLNQVASKTSFTEHYRKLQKDILPGFEKQMSMSGKKLLKKGPAGASASGANASVADGNADGSSFYEELFTYCQKSLRW